MTWLRVRQIALFLLLAACAALGVWAWHTGRLTQAAIASWVDSFGAWAPPAYLLAFVIGELVHVPGMVFIALARAAFGPTNGLLLAYFGAVLSVTVPFLVVRGMRSQRERSWTPRWRLLAKMLERVETHPVSSVIVLRLVLWLSPPLDYALAFTGIRTKDYVLGSAIGLIPSVVGVVFGVGWLGGH